MGLAQQEFDLKDAANIFEYILLYGEDEGFEPDGECKPTEYRPGSWDKVEVLARRNESAQPLWHDDDPKQEMEVTLLAAMTGIVRQPDLN